MARSGLALLVVGALLVMPASTRAGAPPRAPTLTSGERQSLLAFHTVARSKRFEWGHDGSYIGGVSYQLVHASPARVIAALVSADALPHALPRTESARLITSSGRSATIELTQGKAPFLVTYSVKVEQASTGTALRFWLDRSRPHDLKDVWGYVRVTPFGRNTSLVTLAVALDMGSGIGRVLFGDRVERTILRAPSKIREFVEPERLTSDR